jgi:hypothetical protein
MFAVIEQQQRLPRAQMADELFIDRNVAYRHDAKRAGNRFWHEARNPEWRQVDPDHAVSERRSHVGCNGDRQTGLANATWPGQRQQRNSFIQQEAASQRPFRFPANEPGTRNRCGGVGRCVAEPRHGFDPSNSRVTTCKEL